MTPEYLRCCGAAAAPSRVIASWQEAFAVVTLGPVTPGNVMILPKTHVRAMSQLGREGLEALTPLVNRIGQMLETAFGPIIMFEHGMSARPSERDVGCMDHAHLQIVPTGINLLPYAQADFGAGVVVGGLASLADFQHVEPYLYLTSPGLGCHVVIPGIQLPSQYMRRLFARMQQRDEEWNWRKYPRLEWMTQTMSTLRTASGVGRAGCDGAQVPNSSRRHEV